ncbi:hypothetical protein M0804_003213 [Polistes exclamans]|nr:hypothetical protein M0804_003213 [Polistes exclamans]
MSIAKRVHARHLDSTPGTLKVPQYLASLASDVSNSTNNPSYNSHNSTLDLDDDDDDNDDDDDDDYGGGSGSGGALNQVFFVDLNDLTGMLLLLLLQKNLKRTDKVINVKMKNFVDVRHKMQGQRMNNTIRDFCLTDGEMYEGWLMVVVLVEYELRISFVVGGGGGGGNDGGLVLEGNVFQSHRIPLFHSDVLERVDRTRIRSVVGGIGGSGGCSCGGGGGAGSGAAGGFGHRGERKKK